MSISTINEAKDEGTLCIFPLQTYMCTCIHTCMHTYMQTDIDKQTLSIHPYKHGHTYNHIHKHSDTIEQTHKCLPLKTQIKILLTETQAYIFSQKKLERSRQLYRDETVIRAYIKVYLKATEPLYFSRRNYKGKRVQKGACVCVCVFVHTKQVLS